MKTFTLLSLASAVSALGINCRGSGLCPRAGWNNHNDFSVMQGLRDAIFTSNKPGNTAYHNDEHIICVSQSQSITIGGSAGYKGVSGTFSLGETLHEGGICLFPQGMPNGAAITLDQIKPLVDKLLEHTCQVCGSIPVHFVDQNSNDPSGGILTFNYVAAPFCTENCLSDVGKRDLGERFVA